MEIKEKYKNTEKRMTPDGCVTRKVVVYKNGKGYKSITTHCPPSRRKKDGKKRSKHKTIRKPLTEQEIEHISKRKFIQGLFHDCREPDNRTTY